MQTESSTPAVPAPVRGTADNCVRVLLNEHAALASVLSSILLMLERGPRDEPERFFDVLRAMLFYIDEFPEQIHHRKESDVLFPKVARLAPKLLPTIEKLERDHIRGESLVHSLQHALVAWEMLGEPRKSAFVDAAREYVAFYFEHMRLEETVVVPAAESLLTADDWKEVDAAFRANRDPLAGAVPIDSTYNRLFTKIVTCAPAPIGVGRG